MSIFSPSTIFNRFAKWAEKQPQVKLEKTLKQMEFISSWRYEDEQDLFARKIKGLVKEGAEIGTPELFRALKVEGNKIWRAFYRRDRKLAVVDVMLNSGAVPDEACFSFAAERRMDCFGAQLRTIENATPGVLRYALEMHGQESTLIAKLLGQCEKMTAGVVFSAIESQTLPKADKVEVVKKIITAGAPLKWEHVRCAIKTGQEKIALELLDAGAPATPLLMGYAVGHDMRAVAEKLHEKGVSFDEALLECEGKELQTKMKHYRKVITGESYVDEDLVKQLQEQIKELTTRIETMEAANTNKPKAARGTAKTAVAKPK